MQKLTNAIRMLVDTGQLTKEYKPHKLRGNYRDVWESHPQPDWLMLWKQDNGELTLLLTATGSHADIFG